MITKTKERPIIFNSEMVRAILDGRKTQTRRVCKVQPYFEEEYDTWHCFYPWGDGGHGIYQSEKEMRDEYDRVMLHKCPYGKVGDRLWCRETWAHEDGGCDDHKCGQPTHIYYKATECYPESIRWRPSIHMPRWASRITLEITDIRVERVKDIKQGDISAEGVDNGKSNPSMGIRHENLQILAWIDLWNSINNDRGYGWDANPWAWVVEFKRVEQ